MMDDETRMIIAQEVADTKNNHDAKNLFRKASEVAEKKPTKLVTDGLSAYREAFLKEYWTREKPRVVEGINKWITLIQNAKQVQCKIKNEF